MSKDLTDIFSLIANIAAILTAFIAVIFYYKTLKRNYYLNDIPGNYKIFSSLRNYENITVLNQIKISHVSQKGWFFGNLTYSEIFNEHGSGGEASVFGKIDYSYLRPLYGMLYRIIRLKKYNPLEVKDFSSFHGTLYFLNRNDLDITKTDWTKYIAQEYSIIHYRDAHRFKLYNPKKSDSYLQLPIELVLINVDKVPDKMYDI